MRQSLMLPIAPLTLGLLLMTASPSTAQTPPPSPPATTTPEIGIDHLILAVDDLQKGIETFARMTGVRPEFGGEHPGRGTANARGAGVPVYAKCQWTAD